MKNVYAHVESTTGACSLLVLLASAEIPRQKNNPMPNKTIHRILQFPVQLKILFGKPHKLDFFLVLNAKIHGASKIPTFIDF